MILKELFLHAPWFLKKLLNMDSSARNVPLFFDLNSSACFCLPLWALCVLELFKSNNWSQNASLPNTQARVLGGIFAPTRRATIHEVIYKEVVFIKLSFFLSHSSVRNTYKGRML